ncbi:MAG: prepilin peptidase [Planctomycetaceae bacterium]
MFEVLSGWNLRWFEFVTRGSLTTVAAVFAPVGLLLGWGVVRFSERLIARERGHAQRLPTTWRLLAIAGATGLAALLPIAVVGWQCQSLVEGGSIDWVQWRLPYHLALLLLLLAATLVDLDCYMIPDEITLGGAALGFLGAGLISNLQLIPLWVDWNAWQIDVGPAIPDWIRQRHHLHGFAWSAVGGLVGAALTLCARWVSQAVLRVESLGFGDVTLMFMIGCFLGWQPVVCVFLLAPLCGVVVALLLQFSSGRRALPYGPCLAAAAVLVLFTWRALWTRTRDLFGHPPTLAGLAVLVIGGMALLLGLLRLYRSIPVARR